jgi:uncharacterized glyoxalase superfamily protein PhnB
MTAEQPVAADGPLRGPPLNRSVSQTEFQAMAVKRVVPIIKVSDIRLAMDFYCSVLGFAKDFQYLASPDGPAYVGISLDGNQLHLSTFSGDGVTGTATYCYVDDVDAVYAGFLNRGLKAHAEPINQTWGMREVYVRDPDGNTLRLGSPIPQAG